MIYNMKFLAMTIIVNSPAVEQNVTTVQFHRKYTAETHLYKLVQATFSQCIALLWKIFIQSSDMISSNSNVWSYKCIKLQPKQYGFYVQQLSFTEYRAWAADIDSSLDFLWHFHSNTKWQASLHHN